MTSNDLKTKTPAPPAFGTVAYIKGGGVPVTWFVTYAGDNSTRHGPFPTRAAAVEYQTTPQD